MFLRTGGREEIRLRKFIELSDWHIASTDLIECFSSDDLKRVLGFGRLLTEFLISPIQSNFQVTTINKAIDLGSLANLIVTIFDQYVESAPMELGAFDRHSLEQISRQKWGFLSQWLQSGSTAKVRVICKLISEYFCQLNKLPYSNRCSPLREFIYHTILSMYDAEVMTAQPFSQLSSKQVLRQKSALPFVTMGLPAWLCVRQTSPPHYWQHLRWLYYFGEFIGWIDDVVDLDPDRRTGQPNRVEKTLAHAPNIVHCQEQIARNMAFLGKQLVHGWCRQVGLASEVMPYEMYMFSALIMSWFGGTQPRR